MSNAIPFGRKTITLYNAYMVDGEDGKTQTRWTSFVFTGCLFRRTQSTKLSDTVTLAGDFTVAQAPENDAYMDYIEWVKISDGDIDSHFTVQDGDVIVEGDVVVEIPVNSTPMIEIKKLYPNIGNHMFEAKTAQVNVDDEMGELNHYYWAG